MTRYYSPTCNRCGIQRGGDEWAHRSPLCGDCRYVLSGAEYAMWVPDEDDE